ncbi:MAG: GNAT family N-acetyltransferase [Acidobacteriia bacterium]|nr:GNAT family N-acetyltransferase [Terriglobia bacterium]
MRLRIAEPADVEAIARLINLAFRVERFFIERDRIDTGAVRELTSKGKFILAEDCASLLGCIYVELRGERGYLGLLAVDPSRQRSGIGSHLMAAAEQRCLDAGCRFADLRIVNVREELPAYYQRLGYLPTGTSPFSADAQPKLPCHFVNMTKLLVRASEAAS